MYTLIDKSLSIFGTFEISEEKMKKIQDFFPEVQLQLGRDRNNNMIGRLQDPQGKAKFGINLSGTRIDYFLGVDKNNDDRFDMLKMIDALSVILDTIKDYGIIRLAYNSRAFIEDEDDAKRAKLGSMIELLNTDSKMIETSIRLNYRENVLNEEVNNIISIQDGVIRSIENPDKPVKSLLMAADVNTVASNTQVRFDKVDFEQFFTAFIEFSKKSYEQLDAFLK